MKIYILRHAIAVPRGTVVYPDDDRPLTEEGARKMSKAARGLAAVIDDVDVILTSPLIRARGTAEIAAVALEAENKIEICRELLPGVATKNLLSYLGKFKELQSLLVVGHEPDLGYLASALIGSGTSVIEFKKGSVCCIEVSTLPPIRPGTLLWHLTPKILRTIDL